ncbi:hypothetical protein [Noviherbaspirillum sp. Root189]|uniref:hypothetical protein n=1 Tax=Noviherbaspirillum sp. Root189 TaxID=1736487 RepID=UPI0007090003|nr:hypothetical protein [Noviherbaspirillum sp. Root189]KRB89905.1 hypothetical protein ASE07_17355 [Noviherbaspirillum sp. Root189]
MMPVEKLEAISASLNQLKSDLKRALNEGDHPLDGHSALVRQAEECEFMLPEKLTTGALAEAVDRKLANVAVLLERARRHESLPEDAQAAAEQEYMLSDEDYAANAGHPLEHGKEPGVPPQN